MLRFLYIFIFLLPVSHASVDKIVVWERIKQNPYYLNVLLKSLELTQVKYGKVELVPSVKVLNAEALKLLGAGKQIHLAALAPSRKKLKDFIVVPIPLSRGILGMRLCFINKSDQELFKAVRDIEDFKKFGIKFVVGSNWTDKEIIQHNGIETIEAVVYEDLYRLTLLNKKVCFSRSINEILHENDFATSFGLIVESSLLLQYDLPMYVFVSKKRPEIAKRIEEGMRLYKSTLESYYHFWMNFAEVFESYNVKRRKILKMEMPFKYVKDEVLNDPLLWLPGRLSTKKAPQK